LSLPPPRLIANTTETLLIGGIGGAVFGWLHVPAGWLIGSMVLVAAAALGGRPMQIPRRLTNVIFVFIGVSLGAVVTPETLQGMGTWPLSVAVMVVAIVCISILSSGYLRYVHGWGTTASLLASAPGALSQVMVMAGELGVDMRAVAVVQTVRVMVVSIVLPLGLTMLGLVGSDAPSVGGPFNPDLLGELAILIGASAVAGMTFQRFNFPGGLLFGAMVCSGALHGSGLIHAVMPWWAVNAAMLALGCVTGARFTNTSIRMFLNYLGAALGSLTVSVVVAALFIVILVVGTDLRTADVSIAFAPGAVDVMMVLALALSLDPVYIGAHHLARIVVISLAIPIVSHWSIRHERLPPEPEPPPVRKVPFDD
jgi:membrane AbrB-like protein